MPEMTRALFAGLARCAGLARWTGGQRAAAVGVLLLGAAALPAQALAPVALSATFDSPVFLTAPAGDSRLFIVERSGRIQLYDNGTVTQYLDISSQVATSGERGLLGMAFDPNFASNGRFYVNYIDSVSLNTVVASFTAASASATSVDPLTQLPVLTVAQPAGRSNHKAGWIGFRPGDGNNLYIATGDGGSGNDPDNLAQNLNSNLGKILRVTPQAGGGYSVPADNPFVGATPGNDEIWSYGLRNPYRNSFDRATGDFWIADVGQNTREEVNFEANGTAGGRNYGWRAREGSGDNPGVGDPPPAGAVNPFYDFAHSPSGSTVIGGYVYRGSAEAGLDGTYFFADFNTGSIYSFRNVAGAVADFTDRSAELGAGFDGFEFGAFGEDGQGNLYMLSLNGEIYRFANAVPEPASAALLLGGLGLLGWRRRRRA